MKRLHLKLVGLFGLFALGGIIVSSCSTTGGASGAPAPSNRMARLSNVKMDTLNIGYEAYVRHCTECHADRTPVPPVGRPWHPDSLGMSLYSSLNSQERYGIQQYLKAANKASFGVDTGSLLDTR